MEAFYIVLWWLFAVTSGASEAFLYNIRDAEKSNPINEHKIFTTMRLAAFLPVLVLYLVSVGGVWYIELLVFSITAVLTFPFFHDGAYYTIRDILKPGTYPKRWMDHSSTSSAVLTKYLTYTVRIIMGVVGLFLLFSA